EGDLDLDADRGLAGRADPGDSGVGLAPRRRVRLARRADLDVDLDHLVLEGLCGPVPDAVRGARAPLRVEGVRVDPEVAVRPRGPEAVGARLLGAPLALELEVEGPRDRAAV